MGKSFFRKALFLIYLLAFIFIGSEILVRIFDPLNIYHFFEMKSVLNTMPHNDIYEYTQQPGLEKEFRDFNIRINSAGFRWSEFPAKKDSAKKRILLIGDSMVFGWGVPLARIFPDRIRQYADSSNKNWEVFPAGVISWNTRNEVEYLKAEGIKYDPDLVIFVAFANDVLPKPFSRTTVAKAELFPNLAYLKNPPLWRKVIFGAARQVVYRSHALTSLMYIFAWRNQNDDFYAHYAGDTPAWRDVALALEELEAFCRERGKALAFVLADYENNQNPSAQIYLRKYRDKLNALNIPNQEIVMAFGRPALRNSAIDGHPNGAGHRIIAGDMISYIEELMGEN